MSLLFKILVFYLLFWNCLKSEGQSCLSADMIIMIDWSGSEAGHEKELSVAALKFVSNLPVRKDLLRIGVLTFSDQNTNVVKLTGDKDILTEGILNLSTTKAGGNTYIANAINIAIDELNNDRMVRKIIVIITDGEIYDVPLAMENMEQGRTVISLNVFGVLVGEDYNLQPYYLTQIVGDSTHIETVVPTQLVEGLKKLSICN